MTWHPRGWHPAVFWSNGEEADGELRLALGRIDPDDFVSASYAATGDEAHSRAAWLHLCARAWARQREAR